MWFLERKKDRKVVYILCNKEYTFGRKNCTVLVPEDPSVSRNHLIIRVDFPAENVSGRPPLKIKDLGSTYGSYVNPVSEKQDGKIEPHTWVDISKDSILHFGLGNVWSIQWLDITVLCSAMAPTGRKKLSAQLTKLGARQMADWNDKVTHLVMEKVVFTHKVMQCLIASKPIVGVEYFETWTENLENDPSAPAPNFADHIPQIDSQLAHIERKLFLPKAERHKIFQGMIFIFPTPEQYDSMAKPVSSAGGVSVQTYTNEKAILIEHTGPNPSKDYMLMFNLQKQQGRRAIPVKEIGLAVLHCSTERYCNQTFNLEQTLFKNVPAQSSKSNNKIPGAVLAPETQAAASSTQNVPIRKQKIKVVPDSPVKGPASKRICLEAKEEPMDTTEQDAETQLVARRSSIFPLDQSSTIPDTPDGAALGKPTRTHSKSSLLLESKPGPLSKKLQHSVLLSDTPSRGKDELACRQKTVSPSQDNVQKAKPCPLSKKSHSTSQEEVQSTSTSPENFRTNVKPSPLSKKPSSFRSPEDVQTTSKSPVTGKPGPLSKKNSIARCAEEVQMASGNSENLTAVKPGPLSKKLPNSRDTEQNRTACISPENVPAANAGPRANFEKVPIAKPGPLSKKLGISQGAEETRVTCASPKNVPAADLGPANNKSEKDPTVKPGPLSRKLAISKGTEGIRASCASPTNVPAADPDPTSNIGKALGTKLAPLSKKMAISRSEENRTTENLSSTKLGPLSKKMANHRNVEVGSEVESIVSSPENVPAAKPSLLPQKLIHCEDEKETQTKTTSPDVAEFEYGPRPHGNKNGKASCNNENIEMQPKKAQKTSRSPDSSYVDNMGRLSKKIALQHSIPTTPLVRMSGSSMEPKKFPDSPSSALQSGKGVKRPVSPSAAVITPNAKKAQLSDSSPKNLFQQSNGTLNRETSFSSSLSNATLSCFKGKTNVSRLGGHNSTGWEQAKEHSSLNESMSKLAVRCKLLRPDRTISSVSMNETKRSNWSQLPSETKLPAQRIRIFRVVYFKDGKWEKGGKTIKHE